MIALHGRLTKLNAELVKTAIDPYAKPHPAVDGQPDTRTPGKRNADALVELSRQTLDSGTLPSVGGQKPHLTLTVTREELKAEAGVCDLEQGGHITSDQARRLREGFPEWRAAGLPVNVGAPSGG